MSIVHFVAAAAIAGLSSAALAQFVKANEAVRLMPDGTKRIETPPLPTTGPIRTAKPCAQCR